MDYSKPKLLQSAWIWSGVVLLCVAALMPVAVSLLFPVPPPEAYAAALGPPTLLLLASGAGSIVVGLCRCVYFTFRKPAPRIIQLPLR